MEPEIKYKYWKWSNSTIIAEKTSRQDKPPKSLPINNNIPPKTDQNKREVCSDRISQREMHIQTNINPYMRKLDYVNDLKNQDEFLRPLDSNF